MKRVLNVVGKILVVAMIAAVAYIASSALLAHGNRLRGVDDAAHKAVR